jgi:probable rRNA maturation factor
MERRRKHKSHRSSKDSNYSITIHNRQSNLPIAVDSIRKAVVFFLQEKKVDCKELSVYLVGKRKIATLHGEHFNDPTPTDCITFPLDDDFLGEIFICPKAALEANPRQPYIETTLYIFHCLLHLLGYDDIDKKQRARMRREEKRLMALARRNRCILEQSS